MRQELPIDLHLDAIAEALKGRGGAIVVAEPGAGKTTRVPAMLLDRCTAPVICTQPRRIAVRLSARRVAQERQTSLGGEVGYEVRFERKLSAATRLRFTTEGLALRQWSAWAGRERILMLDEFHERHLDGDMLLALAAEERRHNAGLSLVVMSATLDAEPLSAFLDLPIVKSEGREHPVELRSLPTRETERLEQSVARALREALAGSKVGDVLIFLPGMAEIRRCQDKLEALAHQFDLLIVPLHGGLASDKQDLALRPSAKRKVILATNVAETSLTIDGVTTVIDSGTARVARHSPWTGLASLQVEPISQASAKQRAGRAGRTGPGQCIRLYSEHDLKGRRAFDTPEMGRSDLTAAALQLAASGTSLEALRWLDAAPDLARQNAQRLLAQLGAIEDGVLTETGQRMSLLPVHPRLARLVIEAEALGIGSLGAAAAGLLSERPLRRARGQGHQATASSTSDVLDDLDLLEELRASGFRAHVARAAGADLAVARSADKIASQVLRSLGAVGDDPKLSGEERDRALRRALLAGFPDRAGRRVRARGESVLLCQGGAVTLSRSSAVLDAEYLLGIDVEARSDARGRSVILRVASAIDPSWLLDMPGLREIDEHEYQSDEQRVVRRTGIYYGDIAIDEEIIVDPNRMNAESASRVLRRALLDGKLQQVVDSKALEAYRLRYEFAAKFSADDSWPALDEQRLVDALLGMVDRPTRLGDLRSLSIVDAVHVSLTSDQRRALERLAPTHVHLPGRARVPVHYEIDRDPWIESRLQDFFGARESPSVAGGKVALVLHLLAPNQRAVQVTTDLPGFWERHYPALRKQLMRRYPKHAWPEKP